MQTFAEKKAMIRYDLEQKFLLQTGKKKLPARKKKQFDRIAREAAKVVDQVGYRRVTVRPRAKRRPKYEGLHGTSKYTIVAIVVRKKK